MDQHHLQKELMTMVSELKSSEFAWPFLAPVDVVAYPEYLDVIRKPMDLSTIERKVRGRQYITRRMLVEDVYLMLDNCLTFNPQGNSYHTTALNFRAHFHKRLNEFQKCDQP